MTHALDTTVRPAGGGVKLHFCRRCDLFLGEGKGFYEAALNHRLEDCVAELGKQIVTMRRRLDQLNRGEESA